MSANKSFYCKLCEREWATLPEGAVQLTNNRGRGHVNTYRFADGSIHVIKKTAKNAEEKS